MTGTNRTARAFRLIHGGAAANEPPALTAFAPGQGWPAELNGVPFAPWRDHPTPDGWDDAGLTNPTLTEPPLAAPAEARVAAAAVVLEKDHRLWALAPASSYDSRTACLPAGAQAAALSLQAVAVRECWERTGLKVRIIGWLGDFDDGVLQHTRYYLAERLGGAPASCAWAQDRVLLATLDALSRPAPFGMSLADRRCLVALRNVLAIG